MAAQGESPSNKNTVVLLNNDLPFGQLKISQPLSP